MKNGIINIYKERGYTSHDVVAKLRKILQQKKIGHTGTLDPDAMGVLPVCLGKGTKLCELLTDKDKTYEAVLLLGQSTDTQDVTGTIQERSEVAVGEKEIEETVLGFVGPYLQVPPMYSALKVGGKKLCDLARAGVEVERKPRSVEIYGIQILKIELPRVRMSVSCSKGTYIRTLCHDIGERLRCHGCMESLVRTKAGRFLLEDSLTLGQVEILQKEGRLDEAILPVDEALEEHPAVYLKEEAGKIGYNGNPLLEEDLQPGHSAGSSGMVRVYDHQKIFVGLYGRRPGQELYRPVKMFYEKQSEER